MGAIRSEGAATDSSRDIFDDPPAAADYLFRDGLRFVTPYFFDYYAYVKPRWVGRTVVDVFTAEFKGRDRSYYDGALAPGRLRVEETSISLPKRRGGVGESSERPAEAAPGALLRDGQRIRHFVHRHEPPVRRCCTGRAQVRQSGAHVLLLAGAGHSRPHPGRHRHAGGRGQARLHAGAPDGAGTGWTVPARADSPDRASTARIV